MPSYQLSHQFICGRHFLSVPPHIGRHHTLQLPLKRYAHSFLCLFKQGKRTVIIPGKGRKNCLLSRQTRFLYSSIYAEGPGVSRVNFPMAIYFHKWIYWYLNGFKWKLPLQKAGNSWTVMIPRLFPPFACCLLSFGEGIFLEGVFWKGLLSQEAWRLTPAVVLACLLKQEGTPSTGKKKLPGDR